VTVLVVKEGPLAGRRVDLGAEELVIGREDAGLTIDDDELSRKHAAVRVVGGDVEIEDLGSRNGTFVNGQRIDGPTRLGGGDSVKIGRTVLELEAPRSAETVASPVRAPAPMTVAAATAGPGVPSEPFGTYAVVASERPLLGVASRQLWPVIIAWTIVIADAVALIIYFAKHNP
jgi:pSer/pThr/pTyr-binding forkhead associated (FHA) protein